MSKYTTSLYNYFKSLARINDNQYYNNFNDLFLPFNFYNDNVNDKNNFINEFCNFYMFEEIEFETIELFKIKLQNKLNLIMPKYKNIYKAESEYKNIFYDNVYTEKTNGKNTKTANQNTTSSTDNTTTSRSQGSNQLYHSDTPSIAITQNYYSTKDDGNSTASGTDTSQSSGTNTFTNNETNTDEYTKTITSINKSYAENLELAKTIKSINMMIIEECSDLFMQIL